MPVHDWSRVDDGVFHSFHVAFIAALCEELNERLLPRDYYAAAEQVGGRGIPDVLTLSEFDAEGEPDGGVSVAVAPPRLAHHALADPAVYLSKVNRVAVRRTNGDRVVAVVELVSAGNKAGQAAFDAFVGKVLNYIQRGVHVVVIDYHPPTPRDPHGLHPAIWGELVADDPYRPPADKSLTLASYVAGPVPEAYVQPLAVGDTQPDLPLFLTPERYINLPMEDLYTRRWASFPARWKRLIEPPADA